MSPYDLEEAVRKADKSVADSGFADKAVITETFLLMRYLVRHAADVESDRCLALSNGTRGTEA